VIVLVFQWFLMWKTKYCRWSWFQ